MGLLIVGIVTSRLALEGWTDQRPTSVAQLRWLPRGEIVKPALLGYTQVGADLLWVQVVQTMGAGPAQADDAAWLAHALETITTLDPHFMAAYDLGGGLLAEQLQQVQASNALLRKGVAANPQQWRLPFLLGFNHFFHLHDYDTAARYMAQAARLPGAPVYVAELAARLYVQADDVQSALLFVDAMLEEHPPAQLRTALERRRGEVAIERDLRGLEQARQEYESRTGHPLRNLQELVVQGILSSVPIEPFGGRYELDGPSGRMVSSTHPERLRLFRPIEAQRLAARTE